jgi:alpha-tubulin suppressor-like RCC1 family protein
LSNAQVYCWGDNLSGVFGSGAVQFLAPTHMPQLDQLVTLSFGDSHACGLTAAGVAYCWGGNESGQLGTGDHRQHDRPVPVMRPVSSS